MTAISIPLERFFFGNEHWDSDLAIDEINIYCELLEHLQDKIDSLGTRGKDEELTLLNVQAVISSYAFEIAMKSLWALDNPDKTVPQKHNLVAIWGGEGRDGEVTRATSTDFPKTERDASAFR